MRHNPKSGLRHRRTNDKQITYIELMFQLLNVYSSAIDEAYCEEHSRLLGRMMARAWSRWPRLDHLKRRRSHSNICAFNAFSNWRFVGWAKRGVCNERSTPWEPPPPLWRGAGPLPPFATSEQHFFFLSKKTSKFGYFIVDHFFFFFYRRPK